MNFWQFLNRYRHALAAGLSLLLFLLALWVLHRELSHVRLSDIRAAFGQVPATALLLALAGTAGSYLALTGYDALALRYLGHRLPYARVALVSTIASAVGHNLGMAIVSAGAVRLRLYTASGLSATEVGGMAAMVGLTFGVGVTFIAGLVVVLEPAEAGLLLHVPDGLVQAIAGLVLAAIGGYAAVGLLRRAPFSLGGWQIRIPGPDIVAGQLLLAVVDLGCAAAALYWLLPADVAVSYPVFLGIYVLAVVAGIASHVPAGLGVFETVLLLALPAAPREDLLAAILAYRAIYYLLPLSLAARYCRDGAVQLRAA